MLQDFFFGGEALVPAPFYVWGIVNTTPDSFHDGGLYLAQEEALCHAKSLWNQGAAILDIGGASSRPGAKDVPAEEEWKRISPLLTSIRKNPQGFCNASLAEKVESSQTRAHTADGREESIFTKNPLYARRESPVISIDTWRADVASKALENGADIINDISAFSWDEKLLDVVAEHKPGYVLMHCQGRPQRMQNEPVYTDIVEDVVRFFEEKMNTLVQKGLPENHIILDPGIGFGKNINHNITLLQASQKLAKLGRPILLGISYKSLFGHLFGIKAEKRKSITQVCTALMAQYGIQHHRVHDVLATVESLTLQAVLQEKGTV